MRITTTMVTPELNAAAKVAVKAFRDSKPWRGTLEERADKFAELHRGMCRAYDLETILVRDDAGDITHEQCSGGSEYDARTNRIIQRGRLSVVTYLYLFSLAVGNRRLQGMTLARKTFSHYFPRSFARCRDIGGLLVKN